MVTVTTAEMVPRFLLPRLSWQSAPRRVAATMAARHLHSIPAAKQRPLPTYTSTAAPLPGSPILSRAFHTTHIRQRDHHFDTLKFVKRLRDEGFTEEQSVAMMRVLSDVIEER